MILTRDPEIRRTAARILLAQAVSTAALALIYFGIWGARQGGSALVGGAIGLSANLYMTLTALRPARSAGGALGRLFLGQLVKVGLTVALFVIVARTGRAAWVPLLVAYLATLIVFWAVPMLSALRATPAVGGGGKLDQS